eukprot:7137_1
MGFNFSLSLLILCLWINYGQCNLQSALKQGKTLVFSESIKTQYDVGNQRDYIFQLREPDTHTLAPQRIELHVHASYVDIKDRVVDVIIPQTHCNVYPIGGISEGLPTEKFEISRIQQDLAAIIKTEIEKDITAKITRRRRKKAWQTPTALEVNRHEFMGGGWSIHENLRKNPIFMATYPDGEKGMGLKRLDLTEVQDCLRLGERNVKKYRMSNPNQCGRVTDSQIMHDRNFYCCYIYYTYINLQIDNIKKCASSWSSKDFQIDESLPDNIKFTALDTDGQQWIKRFQFCLQTGRELAKKRKISGISETGPEMHKYAGLDPYQRYSVKEYLKMKQRHEAILEEARSGRLQHIKMMGQQQQAPAANNDHNSNSVGRQQAPAANNDHNSNSVGRQQAPAANNDHNSNSVGRQQPPAASTKKAAKKKSRSRNKRKKRRPQNPPPQNPPPKAKVEELSMIYSEASSFPYLVENPQRSERMPYFYQDDGYIDLDNKLFIVYITVITILMCIIGVICIAIPIIIIICVIKFKEHAPATLWNDNNNIVC